MKKNQKNRSICLCFQISISNPQFQSAIWRNLNKPNLNPGRFKIDRFRNRNDKGGKGGIATQTPWEFSLRRTCQVRKGQVRKAIKSKIIQNTKAPPICIPSMRRTTRRASASLTQTVPWGRNIVQHDNVRQDFPFDRRLRLVRVQVQQHLQNEGKTAFLPKL